MWSCTSRNCGKATPVESSTRIHRPALGRPKRKMAAPVKPTACERSTPWSTKLRTHSSTVEIIEVSAANERARKKTATIRSWVAGPPGACAKTSGSTRKVIAELPPPTALSGSSTTANTAIITVSPAMIETLLLARHIVAALRVVSSSLRMYTE